MRNNLISRSLLRKSLQREENIIVNGLPYVRTDAVLAKISMAPSVDAVEVVHGRWESNMYFDEPVMRCTACKRGFAAGHKAERFPYCPNCGAKMDAKDMDVPTKDGGA